MQVMAALSEVLEYLVVVSYHSVFSSLCNSSELVALHDFGASNVKTLDAVMWTFKVATFGTETLIADAGAAESSIWFTQPFWTA